MQEVLRVVPDLEFTPADFVVFSPLVQKSPEVEVFDGEVLTAEEEPSDLLTVKMVVEVLPKSQRTMVTQDLVDKINHCIADQEVAKAVREDFVTYAKVLSEGRYKVSDYLNAIKYVAFKKMNMSNVDAYARTFPEKMIEHAAAGRTDKEISAYVASYHKGKLVNAITEQSMIPFHILNQEHRQKAVNELARIMVTSASDKVRVEAASSLLSNLAPPKDNSINLRINTGESKEVSSIKEELERLSNLQRNAIVSGKESTRAIAGSHLLKADDNDE